jgi:hypothetical protein
MLPGELAGNFSFNTQRCLNDVYHGLHRAIKKDR